MGQKIRPGMMAARLVQVGDVLVEFSTPPVGKIRLRVIGTVLRILQSDPQAGHVWEIKTPGGATRVLDPMTGRNVWVHVRPVA